MFRRVSGEYLVSVATTDFGQVRGEHGAGLDDGVTMDFCLILHTCRDPTRVCAKRWVFESALPHLKASGEAVVINFSSIAAIVGRSGPAGMIFNDGYAAANRGVSLLTETWARMGAPCVRVNEIMLGLIATRHAEQTRGWGLLSETCKKALIEHTLLRRTGSLWETDE